MSDFAWTRLHRKGPGSIRYHLHLPERRQSFNHNVREALHFLWVLVASKAHRNLSGLFPGAHPHSVANERRTTAGNRFNTGNLFSYLPAPNSRVFGCL